VCVEDLVEKQNKPTLFKVTEPSSVPYRTPPACAKRAAYPDPPPVIPLPESIDAQAAYAEDLLPGSAPARNVSRYWGSPRSIYETERQADFDCANPAAYAAFTGADFLDFWSGHFVVTLSSARPRKQSRQLTKTFRTWTDSHIFNVFRNAPITLRILIMCESYPFFLCLCLYSTYVLTLHILLLWPDFGLTCFMFYPH
jgi:hypothetical protein